MHSNETKAKTQAAQQQCGAYDPSEIRGIPTPPAGAIGMDIHCATVNCCKTESTRPWTLRDEAEKSVGYHRSQAEKHDRAIAFLRENPAFDEFVRLVRAGIIQF